VSGPRMYIVYRKLEDANSKLKAVKKGIYNEITQRVDLARETLEIFRSGCCRIPMMLVLLGKMRNSS
jgi:hypothetical protein